MDPRVGARKNNQPTYDLDDADENSFATDWLVDRSLEILERDKNKPFCMMLALPILMVQTPYGNLTIRCMIICFSSSLLP